MTIPSLSSIQLPLTNAAFLNGVDVVPSLDHDFFQIYPGVPVLGNRAPDLESVSSPASLLPFFFALSLMVVRVSS